MQLASDCILQWIGKDSYASKCIAEDFFNSYKVKV